MRVYPWSMRQHMPQQTEQRTKFVYYFVRYSVQFASLAADYCYFIEM